MRGRIALSSATADRTPPLRTAMSPATPALHSPPRPLQSGPSLAQHLERHLAVQDAILTARSLRACPCARGRSSAGRPNGDRRAQVPRQRALLLHEQIAAQQQELPAHSAARRSRRHCAAASDTRRSTCDLGHAALAPVADDANARAPARVCGVYVSYVNMCIGLTSARRGLTH